MTDDSLPALPRVVHPGWISARQMIGTPRSLSKLAVSTVLISALVDRFAVPEELVDNARDISNKAIPPPGRIPSSTVAHAALRALSYRCFFSPTSTSLPSPTLMTATPLLSLPQFRLIELACGRIGDDTPICSQQA